MRVRLPLGAPEEIMSEIVRKLLEELLADIQACRTGKVPTGATLTKMEKRIKDQLAKEPN